MTTVPDRTGSPSEHRVPGLPSPGWFILSFFGYLIAALALRSVVVNWIVGPLWLPITLYILPAAFRGLKARVRP